MADDQRWFSVESCPAAGLAEGGAGGNAGEGKSGEE